MPRPVPPPPIYWVLEDHLSLELPMLRDAPAGSDVLMIESRFAFSMLPYHKKRLAFLISAMRHHADRLRAAGFVVHYYGLGERVYRDSLSAIRDIVGKFGRRRLRVTEPSEHHTLTWIESLPTLLDVEIDVCSETLFLTDRREFARWARSMPSPVMEPFYRTMRQRFDVLMDEHVGPIDGVWNLDKRNRKPAPKGLKVPPVPRFEPDAITSQAIDDVNTFFPDHYGSTNGFAMPVTRDDALAMQRDFFRHRLPRFGDYEDAMVSGRPVLFHSTLSTLLNAGLLLPHEVVHAAEERYHDGLAPLNCVEGFVRQVLGWREYVYGIYWTFMPEYRDRNTRRSSRPLPDFFWTGDTDMNCLRQCIGNVVADGYSHHIQRLMVICNFATLAGISPQAVNDWFLTMYTDSHDWVVTPNVVGMGMNADDGTVATKPYVSSAAYIDRMSDYCSGCRYDPKQRTGEDACPFNYLYWTFLKRFAADYRDNPRMTPLLLNVDAIEPTQMREMMLMRKRFIESFVASEATVELRIGGKAHALR